MASAAKTQLTKPADATITGATQGLSLEFIGVISVKGKVKERPVAINHSTATCRVIAVSGWRSRLESDAIQPMSPAPDVWRRMVLARLQEVRRSNTQVRSWFVLPDENIV